MLEDLRNNAAAASPTNKEALLSAYAKFESLHSFVLQVVGDVSYVKSVTLRYMRHIAVTSVLQVVGGMGRSRALLCSTRKTVALLLESPSSVLATIESALGEALKAAQALEQGLRACKAQIPPAVLSICNGGSGEVS